MTNYKWFQNLFASQFWPSCQEVLSEASLELLKMDEPARKGILKPLLRPSSWGPFQAHN